MTTLTHFTQGQAVARRAALGALYATRLNLLGIETTVIFPLADPDHGLVSASMFTTAGGLSATVTPSEPLADWDTKAGVKGIVPIVRANGTGEEADTPDSTFFERGDGSASGDLAMSLVAVVRLDTVTSHSDPILGKYQAAGTREWRFFVNGGQPSLRLIDDSASVEVVREANSAIPAATWTHIAVTRPASGTGATAMDDAKVYVNGVEVASTAINDAGYAGMEPLSAKIDLLYNSSLASYLKGWVAGGPLGPAFCQTKLTPAQVRADYELTRKAMAL